VQTAGWQQKEAGWLSLGLHTQHISYAINSAAAQWLCHVLQHDVQVLLVAACCPIPGLRVLVHMLCSSGGGQQVLHQTMGSYCVAVCAAAQH
jgi:hypothetical protein